MDTLICALFYLNVISPGGHYTANDINNFAAIYAPQIITIKSNPALLETVIGEEGPLAIWVMDNLGG